jgi:hypothetical protein
MTWSHRANDPLIHRRPTHLLALLVGTLRNIARERSKRQRKAFGTAAPQVFDCAETGLSKETGQRALHSLPKNPSLPKNLAARDHLTAL